MSRSRIVWIACVTLALSSLACSANTGGGSTPAPTLMPAPTVPPPPPTTAPPPTLPPTVKPLATDTRVPTSTPAQASGVLFTDDFGSQSASEDKGWSFEPGENVDYIWSANKFTLSVKKSNWLGLNWPDGAYDNFGAEVDLQPVSGSFAEYGLAFRVSGEEGARSYYLFGVTTDGKYHLQKKLAGQWAATDPVPDTPSQYIKQGNAKNTLSVLVQGSNISLYINRFLVKTVVDTSIAGKGHVGVFAGTGDNATAQVAASKYAILTADKAKAEWGATLAPDAQPTPTKAASGGGTAMYVVNQFSGACQVDVWGPRNATIRAEGNSTKSMALPAGTYGGKVSLANGREGDIPNQFYLPPGGSCTIVCYEKSYSGPACK